MQVLKETGIWDDALVVFHTDNGGEIMAQYCGGNNWPLRGGKFSNFEGIYTVSHHTTRQDIDLDILHERWHSSQCIRHRRLPT